MLEGLLGYADHADVPACLPAVLKTATRLVRCLELRSVFPGEFGPDWQSAATYRCLTGEAQISGVWLRLHALTRDARFLNSALKLLDRLKATQSLTSSNPGVRGGIKGSQPIWARYHRLSFVNWGAKFLADALMAEIEAVDALEQRVVLVHTHRHQVDAVLRVRHGDHELRNVHRDAFNGSPSPRRTETSMR